MAEAKPMTDAGGKKRHSLTAHLATIRVVQQLLRTAGPRKCGGVRRSEFDALLVELDELHDLVTWLELHRREFVEWRAGRKRRDDE
jgi:hypothetical protein